MAFSPNPWVGLPGLPGYTRRVTSSSPTRVVLAGNVVLRRCRILHLIFIHLFIHLFILFVTVFVVNMDDSQSSFQSDTASLASSLVPPSVLTKAPDFLVYKEKCWQIVPHQPNRNRGSQTSAIWDWGNEYVWEDDYKLTAWRCGLCVNDYVSIMHSNSTGNARGHLRGKHKMDKLEGRKLPKRPEHDSNAGQFKSLYHVVKIDDFWYHLTRWIVENHLPFNVVEDTNFRAMLVCLNDTVNKHVKKTGDTIRNWVQEEFVTAQNIIQTEVLDRAISKIHVSCDVWSSPNGYALAGIAGHFVSYEGKLETVLLGLRRL